MTGQALHLDCRLWVERDGEETLVVEGHVLGLHAVEEGASVVLWVTAKRVRSLIRDLGRVAGVSGPVRACVLS